MYRTNDVALVGAILERKSLGDHLGLIEALRELWRTQPDPATHDDDPLESEAWQVVIEAGAVSDAVQMGVAMVREEQLLRPRGFLHVVQNIRGMRGRLLELDADYEQPLELIAEDAELLLEIATIVRAQNWPADPYLGMVFIKLVEGRAKRWLWPYLQSELGHLQGAAETWQLVAVVAASTSLTLDLNEWLGSMPSQEQVPAWMLGLYEHFVWNGRIPDDAVAPAIASMAESGDTDDYLWQRRVVAALRDQRWDEYLALVDESPDRLDYAMGEGVEHPVVGYLNRFKDSHRVTEEHFAVQPPVGLVATAREGIGTNQGIVDLCNQLGGGTQGRVLRLFRQLLRVRDRSPREVLSLWRDFRSFKKPTSMSWVSPTWDKAVRARSRWTTRVRYSIFG